MIQCRGSTVAFDHNPGRGPLPKSRLGAELADVTDEDSAWRLHPNWNAGWRDFIFQRIRTMQVVPELKTVWSGFHGKTTSQPRDALGIFANMMRLSAGQISRMPVENQMRAILRTAIDRKGRLRAGIFFSPITRMPSTGSLYDFDRWIPRFPGEGGDLDDRGRFVRAAWTGFSLEINQCRNVVKEEEGVSGLRCRDRKLQSFMSSSISGFWKFSCVFTSNYLSFPTM